MSEQKKTSKSTVTELAHIFTNSTKKPSAEPPSFTSSTGKVVKPSQGSVSQASVKQTTALDTSAKNSDS